MLLDPDPHSQYGSESVAAFPNGSESGSAFPTLNGSGSSTAKSMPIRIHYTGIKVLFCDELHPDPDFLHIEARASNMDLVQLVRMFVWYPVPYRTLLIKNSKVCLRINYFYILVGSVSSLFLEQDPDLVHHGPDQ
jgi:hypothetical protein